MTSDLAVRGGARRRSRTPGLEAERLDLIIVATTTPDHTFPACAAAVQAKLGARSGRRVRPSGGLQRLRLRARGGRQLRQGRARPRRAGDRRRDLLAAPRLGATAAPACCSATAPAPSCCAPSRAPARSSIAACWRRCWAPTGGTTSDLYVDGGPSSTGTTGHRPDERPRGLPLRGQRAQHRDAPQCWQIGGLEVDDVDWLVPHQANRRILEAVRRDLGSARGSHPGHGRPARQHLGRLDAAGAGRSRSVGPAAAEPDRGDQRHGRRLHLGSGAAPLVASTIRLLPRYALAVEIRLPSVDGTS